MDYWCRSAPYRDWSGDPGSCGPDFTAKAPHANPRSREGVTLIEAVLVCLFEGAQQGWWHGCLIDLLIAPPEPRAAPEDELLPPHRLQVSPRNLKVRTVYISLDVLLLPAFPRHTQSLHDLQVQIDSTPWERHERLCLPYGDCGSPSRCSPLATLECSPPLFGLLACVCGFAEEAVVCIQHSFEAILDVVESLHSWGMSGSSRPPSSSRRCMRRLVAVSDDTNDTSEQADVGSNTDFFDGMPMTLQQTMCISSSSSRRCLKWGFFGCCF